MVRAAVLVSCLLAGGCAMLPTGPRTATPLFRDPAMTAQAAHEAIAIGLSSKPQIAALLGPAQVLAFDSGYEVWAYRTRPARVDDAQPELVILFAPSGLVSKVRLRPAAAR